MAKAFHHTTTFVHCIGFVNRLGSLLISQKTIHYIFQFYEETFEQSARVKTYRVSGT